MLHVKYKKINTAFRHPFTTAHGLKTEQVALLVAISFSGHTGFGEAPAIHYYNVSVEQMIEELISKSALLEKYAFTEPERFWHFCHHLFPDNNFLVCALDMAYWNLYSRIKNTPIYKLWGLEWNTTPMTDYTIGIDTAEKMIEKIKETKWPIYKIKVANAEDLSKLELIRQHTDSIIRIDANASWSTEEAISFLPKLNELHIELIEQPLAKDNWDGMKKLYKISSIPLFADESCVSENDVALCNEHFHGINIKLTKCGGLTPAKRMIEEARQLNLKVMMGCMNETEIGSEAIAQFLPLLDYVDMDGPLLLNVPPPARFSYHDGQVKLQ